MAGKLAQIITDAKTQGWYDWITPCGSLHPNDERALLEGCYFDIEAAVHVMDYFVSFLDIRWDKSTELNEWEQFWIQRFRPGFTYTNETRPRSLATKPFVILEWWFKRVIAPIYGWKRPDGLRRFDKGFISTAKKSGKALDVDTPIATACGFKRMGDIQVGDVVFSEDGSRTSVTAVSDVMRNHKCYRVVFSDGSSIIADAEHLWKTRQFDNGNAESVVTTEEIAGTVRGNYGKCNNHSIKVSDPVDFQENDLPVHPYVLGAWLGDGTSQYAAITIHEKDLFIRDEIIRCGVTAEIRGSQFKKEQGVYLVTLGRRFDKKKYGCNYGHLKSQSVKRSSGYYSCLECERETDLARRMRREGLSLLAEGVRSKRVKISLHEKLRKMGLLNNKHIPDEYLYASVEQRTALLQGLMDTDGTCSKSGESSFFTSNKLLAEQFLVLVSSLGIKATIRPKTTRCNGKEFLSWVIKFCAYKDTPVFRLPRKRERQRVRQKCKAPRRSQFRWIVSVEPTDSVPVRCIKVDHPSSMFLAGKSFIPTHNSQTLSGLAGYAMMADGEEDAEVYATAVDRDQAGIVFRRALKMLCAKSSPLRKYLRPLASTYRIVHEKSGSWMEAISSDAASSEGKNPHLLIADEIHVWKDRQFFSSLQYGDIARPQPLFLMITTAGENTISVGFEEYEFACNLLDPNNDFYSQKHFAFIAEAGRDFHTGVVAPQKPGEKWNFDWTDPKEWINANPSLLEGVGSVDKLQSKCDEAIATPSKKSSAIRYLCNRWIGQAEEAYFSQDYWRECREDGLMPNPGETVFCGFDFATVEDLVALTTAWWIENGLLGTRTRFFMPFEGVRDKEERWKVPLQMWIDDGWIETTPGRTVDTGFLRAAISGVLLSKAGEVSKERNPNAIAELYDLQGFFYDRARAKDLVVVTLGEYDGINVVEHGQSFLDMSNQTKALKKMISDGTIRHEGNPVMDWMMGHCIVDQDANGNVKPNKKKSAQKIDGIVSHVMALTGALTSEPPVESVYESRGVLVF